MGVVVVFAPVDKMVRAEIAEANASPASGTPRARVSR
jgi:hypothetical protein